MAFVTNQDDELNKQGQAPQTSGASSTVGGGASVQPAGGQGQQPAQGSGFVNLQSYLGMNDTGKLADKLGAGADNANNAYDTQINGAMDSTKKAVDSGVYQSNGGQGDFSTDRSYKGPDAGGAQQIFKNNLSDSTQKNAANDYVGGLGTDDGRSNLLREQNKDQNYSRGMGSFDSALFGGSGKADDLYNSKKAALGTIQSKADTFGSTGAADYSNQAQAKSATNASNDQAAAQNASIAKARADAAADSANYFKQHPNNAGPAQTLAPQDPNNKINYGGNNFSGIRGYF